MRLCFIASDSIHAVKWITYFAEQGHEILWLAVCSPDKTPRLEGVTVRCLGPVEISHWPRFIVAAWKVRREVGAFEPDLVHAHYAGVNGLLGVCAGFHPFVVTAWGSDILVAGQTFFLGKLVRLILKQADVITCDAQHMREAIAALGADQHKLHTIMFGIDTKLFHPPPPSLELGPQKTPVVISLRALEPLYNVETLIRAIPYVLKQHPDVSFIVAGRGSQEEKLKALAAQLGVAEKISFIGWLPNKQLPELLRSCDVYVSTSLSDAGIASSTAEAMSCGLPAVVTDSGENTLWIKDGENGYIVPVRKPLKLAERLVALLKDRDLRIRVGTAARAVIKERDDYYFEMSKMEQLYLELSRKDS